MIATDFDFVAPDTVAGCLAALGEGARVLAGGTWVLPEMGRAESRPARLVHLRRAGIGGVAPLAGGVRIGAMATYAELLASPEVTARTPVLRTMASGITGGWALRNQATVGGSAMAARPSSDVPAALVASGAVARVAGPRGERRIAVHELFTGAQRTSLAPDELLTGFDVPSSAGAGHGYVKLKRGGSSWPIATATALLRLDAAGVCTAATLVLGAVSATPLTVDVAGLLVGRTPDAALLAEAAELAAGSVAEPWDDVLAPGSYRAAVAGPVARRALTSAVQDATATTLETA